jgi:hypothetical protein
LPNLTSSQWKYLFVGIVLLDLMIAAGVLYLVTATGLATKSLPAPTAVAAGPVATATIKPWEGPPRSSPTATRLFTPPTPLGTRVLAESGFPPGFTPTPRPTREPIYISFPQIYPVSGGSVDVPVVNQVLYPEPFFAPGTNSACGPVALYAAIYGLGLNIDYNRLRDIAVTNGFGPSGISKAGLINTLITLNNDLGNPLTIEYNEQYYLKDLTQHLRQQSVVIVLVYVRKENGRYYLTTADTGAIGHFLLVEYINSRTKKVRLAGSTLGMEEVSLPEFVQSWTNSPLNMAAGGEALNQGNVGWALILKRQE